MPLTRPRLLPATIATMSALLLLKSALLVQAAAEEPAAAKASEAAPAMAAVSASPPVHAAAAAPRAGTSLSAAPPEAAAPAGIGTQPAPMSDGERAVLLSLRARREALDNQARALDQRAAELDAAGHRLEERVRQLAALQTRLEDLEAGRQAHRTENWAGLVKTYEAMKPREAAAIFDALDMQVLLQVLDRMQERRAAPVLAAMQPDRARLATQLLAEMRTRATAVPEPAAPSPSAPKG